jgi:inhibitor of cysteine peptidase
MALVAVLFLAGACGGEENPPSYGVTASTIEAEVSDRFAITIDENPSLGDAWQFQKEGDPEVVELVDDEWETSAEDPETVGAGGTRTLTFEAVGPGETEIVLFNCFRCDDGKPPAEPPPGDIEIGGPYSWTVAVE